MKILYISNRKPIAKEEALKWFQFYCEKPEDLYLHQNLKSAKDFLLKEVIEAKKHLDFIVTDWQFLNSNSKTLLNWIRQSDEFYSGNNFLFRSLPVILIEDKSKQSASISDGFDAVIQDFPTNSLKIKYSIKDAIKTWRYSLAEDLDLIGLDPKTQIIYTNHRSNFISYYKLKILTRNFVDNKSKRLNYIWTNEKSKSLYESSNKFLDKMNSTLKNPPKYLEKEIHDFFRSNPTFIKGEDFSTSNAEMIYEKHFYKNGTRKYDEPDFVNKPYTYALRSPEIFEIKRQSQKILTVKNDRFLSKTKKVSNKLRDIKTILNQKVHYIKNTLNSIWEKIMNHMNILY